MNFEKEIIFDRQTHDYAMYLDGRFVGYATSYHVAEIALDRLAMEELKFHTNLPADFKNETNAAADTQAA